MSGTLPIQIFSKAAALDRGTICTIKTIYFMNISSYLSHIKCFVKDCPPRPCPVSVKQLARVFKVEYFSRNLILYRNNDVSHCCMIFHGVYTPYSTESLTLLEYLEAFLLDIFICL